jgi:hypothetical protein
MKCLQRQRAGGNLRQHDACHCSLCIYDLFIMYSLHIIYLLFSTCSGSMREVPNSNAMPAIIILFIYCLLFIVYISCYYTAAACVRHPAAAG